VSRSIDQSGPARLAKAPVADRVVREDGRILVGDFGLARTTDGAPEEARLPSAAVLGVGTPITVSGTIAGW